MKRRKARRSFSTPLSVHDQRSVAKKMARRPGMFRWRRVPGAKLIVLGAKADSTRFAFSLGRWVPLIPPMSLIVVRGRFTDDDQEGRLDVTITPSYVGFLISLLSGGLIAVIALGFIWSAARSTAAYGSLPASLRILAGLIVVMAGTGGAIFLHRSSLHAAQQRDEGGLFVRQLFTATEETLARDQQ